MTQSDVTVSTRQAPWLKLGKLADDVLTVDQALEAGGLNFTVSLRDVQYGPKPTPEQEFISGMAGWKSAPKRRAIVRDDNDEFFEVVSADYQVVQYPDAMQFVDEIHPEFVAAGTLRGGRQGFMVVRLPGLSEVEALQKVDPHELFAVLRTSHDRTRAVELSLMPLRGMCMNMLPLSTFSAGAKQRWAIPHAGKVNERLAQAAQTLKWAEAYAVSYADTATRLIDRKMTRDDGEQLLMRVVRKSPKQTELVNRMLDAWQTDATVGFTDSAWGLVNAVSSHMQWDRKGGTDASRLTGALSGSIHNVVNRVAARALSR
jgi:phage/plasmid-like protein (TIGR03299 family)